MVPACHFHHRQPEYPLISDVARGIIGKNTNIDLSTCDVKLYFEGLESSKREQRADTPTCAPPYVPERCRAICSALSKYCPIRDLSKLLTRLNAKRLQREPSYR